MVPSQVTTVFTARHVLSIPLRPRVCLARVDEGLYTGPIFGPFGGDVAFIQRPAASYYVQSPLEPLLFRDHSARLAPEWHHGTEVCMAPRRVVCASDSSPSCSVTGTQPPCRDRRPLTQLTGRGLRDPSRPRLASAHATPRPPASPTHWPAHALDLSQWRVHRCRP